MAVDSPHTRAVKAQPCSTSCSWIGRGRRAPRTVVGRIQPIDTMGGAPYISRMRKTTIYLDDDLYRTVQRLADASGRTQAQIIRDALLAYARGARPRPRSIGLGAGGPHLSEQADKLLSGFGEDE